MDQESLSKFLLTKKNIRKLLINLDFEEKIRRVVEMQKMSREFKRDKNKKIYVWNL